ncbi:hypothetical protein JQK87_14070 [Streptomyces sp. G44]|uniref:hypothetical protein n=1 Tax=Streptomyces sp. G44 TaxID=2807632 RepID=UPI00195F6C7C|nr:hypothetical protein [Streptomyces sp. G44]MBM7169519.1 hypothetical protein [Streptomyces sp. G44]
MISHVPSAHGPVGEGDGVAVSAGSDAGTPEREPLGRLWAADPPEESEESEESEEHDVSAAAVATATITVATT